MEEVERVEEGERERERERERKRYRKRKRKSKSENQMTSPQQRITASSNNLSQIHESNH